MRRKIVFFPGVAATKCYVPDQSSHTSLGCRLTQEIILIALNCAVLAERCEHTPPRKFEIVAFLRPAKILRKIRKFFPVYACTGTPIHVRCFNKRSKNFDRRLNRRQKNYRWRKSHCEKIALRSRWVCLATTMTKTTSVSSLSRHSVEHAWVNTGDEFVRTADRTRHAIKPNCPRRFGVKWSKSITFSDCQGHLTIAT